MWEIKITTNLIKNVCIFCCLTEWHLKRNDSTERGKLVVQYHLGTFVWSTHSCPALHSLMCLQVKCFHQLPQTKCLFFIPMMYWRKKPYHINYPKRCSQVVTLKLQIAKAVFWFGQQVGWALHLESQLVADHRGAHKSDTAWKFTCVGLWPLFRLFCICEIQAQVAWQKWKTM